MTPVADLSGGQPLQELLVNLVVIKHTDPSILDALNLCYFCVFTTHKPGQDKTPEAPTALEDYKPFLNAFKTLWYLLLLFVMPNILKDLFC